MKMFLLLSLLLFSPINASAEELTLNDLQKVFSALRDCGTLTCQKSADDVWAVVQSDGIVIFYGRERGNITGRGKTVQEAISNLVRNMQLHSIDYNRATKSLAPFLAGQ